jgi:hypothetical protein
MKKTLIKNLIAVALGCFVCTLGLFGAESFLRYRYGRAFPEQAQQYHILDYSFNPRILFHSAIFRRSLLPSPTAPSPRIFCLGGSTTNGCNMPFWWSFPFLLQRIYDSHTMPASVYNFGISGIGSVTTNSFIHNILPAYKPDCVIIHDGYNDIPIVVKKHPNNTYSYIKPNYEKPYDPYIKNPILRYLVSWVKVNLRATYRFIVTSLQSRYKASDLFLGFDYKRYRLFEGGEQDIFQENDKRYEIFLRKEFDSIDYCLKNNITVVIILEPYIIPHHFYPAYGTGFRDENAAEIMAQCHKIQQDRFAQALYARYQDRKGLLILDMRTFSLQFYKELFYDECHLNGKGNFILATILFQTLNPTVK